MSSLVCPSCDSSIPLAAAGGMAFCSSCGWDETTGRSSWVPSTPPPRKLPKKTGGLGALMDTLNQRIKEFEKALVDLGLGVPAEVEMGDTRKLCFHKTSSGFRLEVWTGTVHTSLVNCSREARLQAVEYFEKLYDELISSMVGEVDRVRTAIRKVESVTDLVKTMKRNQETKS